MQHDILLSVFTQLAAPRRWLGMDQDAQCKTCCKLLAGIFLKAINNITIYGRRERPIIGSARILIDRPLIYLVMLVD
jgi:hypothetical protein